jgi:nucleoside triphosphate pyrophosphatase
MITDRFNKFKIILASRSPRRLQLLRETGLKFDVVIRDYDEHYPEGLNGQEIACYVAREKAASFKSEVSDNEIVIAADTIVWCNGRVLGKPADSREAVEILRQISGNMHEVITGVSILSGEKQITFSDSTKVTFEHLEEDDIEYYVRNYKPFDKAGAYGIQEWIGILACNKIEGSYFNVVGLPVHRLYRELKEFIND